MQQITMHYLSRRADISARFFIFAFGNGRKIREVETVVYHFAPEKSIKAPSIKAKTIIL